MKRSILAVIILLLLAVGTPIILGFSVPSQAASQIQLESSLVGSTPHVSVDGISSAGAPWVITAGEVGLAPNGMLHLSVVGLLLNLPGTPLDGTTGPVTLVQASLVCESTTGVFVSSTGSVPLRSNGNAQINQKINLPSLCFGPVILLRISGTVSGPVSNGPWIASSGFRPQK